MRSLTMSVLLSALALVACAAPQKPAASAVEEPPVIAAAKPDAAPRLHAKLSLPPGWFVVQGSKLDLDQGGRVVKLVNPTLKAKGAIEFVPASLKDPVQVCGNMIKFVLRRGARIIDVFDTPDDSACGFAWADRNLVGAIASLNSPGAGGWTATIVLVYPAGYEAHFLPRDVGTLANSLELERR